jgi:hypothetical protein
MAGIFISYRARDFLFTNSLSGFSIYEFFVAFPNSGFPIPASQFRLPNLRILCQVSQFANSLSCFPTPASQLRLPNSGFPTPASQFRLPDSGFPTPAS